MAKNEVIVLNEGLETRTNNKTGKTRFSVRIEAEPVFVVTDPKTLGAPVAQAIAHHLKQKTLGIGQVASAATLKARQVAELAMQVGKPWAMKRYAGGKIGSKPPNTSDRLFNDSGRFAESITANASSDGAWRVNVAANRLSGPPETVQRIWRRLLELVPEFGNIALLLEQNKVLDKMVAKMITKGKATAGRASAWDVAKAAAQVIRTAADIVAA
jgi:hypothetical protein